MLFNDKNDQIISNESNLELYYNIKNIIFNMGNKEKWRLILDHF